MRRCALVLLMCVGTAAAEPLDAAIERAKAADMPLVVELGAEWCKPCKVFEKDILPDMRVQKALASVVFVRYDADEPQGKDAVTRLSARSFPTFVVLGNGIERHRQTGIPDGEAGVAVFLDILDRAGAALEDPKTMAEKLRARAGDTAFQLRAARWYVARDLPREGLAHFEAISQNPRATPDQRAAARKEGRHVRRVLGWRQQLIDETLEEVRRDPALATEEELIIATIESGVPADVVREIYRKAMTGAHEDRKNTLVYLALAAGATEEALVAAKANAAARPVPQFLDTLAEVHHVRGDRVRALAVEDEAITAASGAVLEKALKRNRARFASGRQDSDEVKRARARATAMRERFEHVDDLDVVREEVPVRNEAMERVKKAYEVEQQLKLGVIKECRRFADGTARVYARVATRADRIHRLALFTDGTASSSLQGCLRRELVGAALPTRFDSQRERLLELYFKPDATDVAR